MFLNFFLPFVFWAMQGTLVIKAPKRIMRTVLVVMVMVSGVYICCSSGATRLSTQVINKPKMRFISDQKIHPQQQPQQHCSHSHQLNQSESHFLHYPKPRTFNRYSLNPATPFMGCMISALPNFHQNATFATETSSFFGLQLGNSPTIIDGILMKKMEVQ